MTHLVNSLQFHLTCRDEWLAFNLRQNFAHTLQDQIAEIIDRVCTEQVGEQESVRIERIQVDMGSFTAHTLSSSFRPVFLHKFEQALTEQLSKISQADIKTPAAVQEDLLEYFLQYGRLPWWTSGIDFDPTAISTALIQEPDSRLKQFFTKHKASAAIWARTAWQLSDAARSRLIALFTELATAQQIFTAWLGEPAPAAGNDQPGTGPQPTTMQAFILLHAPDIFNAGGQASALWELFNRYAPELVPPNKEAITQLNDKLRSIATKNNWPVAAGEPVAYPADAVTGITGETTDPEIRHTTQHAGLMLLVPFLKQFFTQLGLWNGQEWISREAQFKAVHLLQYLATGQLMPPEYTLTLEKICCGLAVSMPVPLSVTLEETDINEATALLQSVIEHWKSLKHTSVNGLRETFLKREGILTKKDNDWLLHIERKTADVLLDNIPWGFAIARLPWSREIIFVEW